jgi:hypothetical protein
MKNLITLLGIYFFILTIPCLAQTVAIDSRTGQRVVVESSLLGGTKVTPFDEYYGEHSEVMNNVSSIAEQNAPNDSFDFELKKIWGASTNSCSDASNNLIDGVKASPEFPDGYKIKQIGTLGSITNFENTLANVGTESKSIINWWTKGTLDFQDFDILDPPSYHHSLSVVETPDGEYFTIDNWMGGIKTKKVYPIDADGIFFSSNPNETNTQNAEFRMQKTDRGLCAYEEDCEDPLAATEPEEETSPLPPTSEPIEVEVLTSADPNDKLGLRGVGNDRFIKPGRLMEYLIRFENMPDASAPAQEVLIRDTLDTQSYDLSTFELGDITFSDETVDVPEGLQQFSTRVPVLDDQFELLITAVLVPETGIVTWKFTTIDPELNDLPFDPLDGFLPPNQTAPEGEGSVAFNVKAFEELSDGHAIRNEARIIFDLNEPIDTPVWSNLIDITAPSSQVEQFTTSQGSRAFDISWSGSDGGAGISTYDVYLAVNDGPFLLWQKSTPANEGRFVGHPDSTYSFFSVAHDAVGNSEPIKTEADASTTITVSTEDGVADMPIQFELFQNYPNPFNPSTTINFALPEQSDVTIRIYDVTGRRIATLLNENRPAGYHNIVWDAGSVASGTYFYRIKAGEFSTVKTLTLVK